LGCSGRRIPNSRIAQEISETPSPKQNTNKKFGRMVQVVEQLPSMCKILGSIPSIEKKSKISFNRDKG
jgi:hypothetical protein